MVELNTMEPDKLGPKLSSLLKEKLNAQEFEIVQESIESAKGSTEILSKNLLIGIAQTQIQPAMDNNKEEVPGNLVESLICLHYSLNYTVPYNDYFRQAYTDVLAENVQEVEKINIWEELGPKLAAYPNLDHLILLLHGEPGALYLGVPEDPNNPEIDRGLRLISSREMDENEEEEPKFRDVDTSEKPLFEAAASSVVI